MALNRKFYYEYDEVDGTWGVWEEDGGREYAAYFDILMFCTATEQDALDAIELLLDLQGQQ